MPATPLTPLPYGAKPVPGHTRWHPEIPAAAEVVSGGSVRMECHGPWGAREALLCGPLAVVGAEPGDVIVVDVLAVGRGGDVTVPGAHPGVIGCAPGDGGPRIASDGLLQGGVRPGLGAYLPVPARAVCGADRAGEVVSCADTRLVAGSRVVLPVQVRSAKLSVGDLHFGDDCTPLDGWIDLRVNLTKRGVERFHVTGPLLMPA